MPDYGLGYLGKYIQAAELKNLEPTLTIKGVELEQVEDLKDAERRDDDPAKKQRLRERWVVYFAESKSDRGLLLNRTNGECLREMWGRDVTAWVGKRVTLCTQQVRVGPKMEPGIRIKGSPELKEALSFDLRLPRKKAVRVTLLPTAATPGAKDRT